MRILALLIAFSAFLYAQTPAPETFTHSVALNDEVATIDFAKFSSRSTSMTVIEHTSDIEAPIAPEGLFQSVSYDDPRTYIGSVREFPGAMAAGIIRADGEILARIVFSDGTEWQDVNGSVTRRSDNAPGISAPTTLLTSPAGSDVYAADIVLDLPFPQVTASGGTTAKALEMAEYSMTCINMYFLRDAAVTHRIQKVIVRLDEQLDPYMGQTTTGQMLSEIRVQQGSSIDGSNPIEDLDIALTASPQVGGGLAFVGVIGNAVSSNGSSRNGDFTVVGRHELGHNWGSSHFEGGSPEGRTIMSGNGLGKFSSPELLKILNHRNARADAHLDNLGQIAPPLPPRAIDDVITAEIGSPPATISPLSNDNDTNGEELTIESVDLVSQMGHSPTFTETSISVPISSDYSNQTDQFSYTIQDSTERSASARIHTRTFMTGDVLAHYTFDEAETRAIDSSSQVAHATLRGNTNLSDGVLHLDGDGDRADLSIITADTNTITFSTMLFRDGEQNDFAGIIFQNNGISTGLNFGTNNELRYHWNNSSNWAWNSGLTVPDRTWTYVALVISPTSATLYMQPEGQAMQSAVRTLNHSNKAHNRYALGQNTGSSNRYMRGMLDNTLIIRKSLSLSEIEDLAAGGSYACSPIPITGTKIAYDDYRIRWTSAHSAVSDRLYLSSSYTELRDATLNDAADLGVKSAAFHDLTSISTGHYYWRVDSILADGSVIKGSIWTFEIVDSDFSSELILDLSLNTSDGALDSSGRNNHGTFNNAPPHVTGHCDECCSFNEGGSSEQSISFGNASGADDFDFGSETDFTISFWARRSGTASSQVFLSNKDWDNGRNPGWMIGLNGNERLEWNFADGTNRTDYDGPANQLLSDQWYHISASHDRDGNAVIVLDGQIVSTRNISSIGSIDAAFTTNLAADGEKDYFYRGLIDEVKIWRRALSEEELIKLYTTSTSYYKWASRHFSKIDLTDDMTSGRDRDNDSDGLNNMIEYAFGHNPLLRNGSGITLANGIYRVPYNPLAVDVDMIIQQSADLGVTDSWSETDQTITSGVDSISIPYSLDTHPQMFYRVQVTW